MKVCRSGSLAIRNCLFLTTADLEEPPHPVRPASRASRDSNSHRSTTPRPESTTPTKGSESPLGQPRSTSQHLSERRPIGPRSPSPLPPKSPFMRPHAVELPSMDVDLALEATLVNITQPSVTPSRNHHTPSQLPRSKRQPFLPTGNTDATPKVVNGTSVPPSIQPLSIKKKTSVRSSTVGTPSPVRKTHMRNSPLSRTGMRITSPRRVSPQVRSTRTTVSSHSSVRSDVAERVIQQLQTSRDDVRIKSNPR